MQVKDGHLVFESKEEAEAFLLWASRGVSGLMGVDAAKLKGSVEVKTKAKKKGEDDV